MSTRVTQSSGNQIVDDAALRILKEAAPLPKPPQHVFRNNDHVIVRIPISFGV